MHKPTTISAGKLAALAAVAALALAGCSADALSTGFLPSSPDVTNRTGDLITLWTGAWTALLGVGAVTWGLMIWCIVVYRKRKNDNELPVQLQYHVPLELMYTVIPVVLVGVLFAYSHRTTEATLELDDDPDLVIEVYGKQWSWDFNYVDYDVHYSGERVQLTGEAGVEETLPTLYLPVGQNIQFEVQSRDVQHAFWIPEFLYKTDMIPGRTNVFQLVPQEEGVYTGKCAEMCGEFHSEMLFRVEVVSPERFEAVMDEYDAAGNTGLLGDELNRWGNTGGDR